MATRTTAQPDYMAFHRSVSAELSAVKDRIRNLVRHWPTDGEWKEVALRSVLRRHLPETVLVGRGFVVGRERSSTQVDVLIVDARKPTLFKDGDLFVVTPDAVLGVIEVKTTLPAKAALIETLTKLTAVERLCFEETSRDSVWTGLFVFEDGGDVVPQLLEGAAAAFLKTEASVNCISCGPSSFVRFWSDGGAVNSRVAGAVWHGYRLDEVAPSYFLGNLVDALGEASGPSAGFAWFPLIGGKEQYRTHYLSPGTTEVLQY